MEQKQYEDRFVKYLRDSESNSALWTAMMQNFKRIYNTNSVKHYLYFVNAGVHSNNEVYKLIAYMLSKGAVTLEGGVSMGKALKLIERNEKVVNGLIKCPSHRLIPKLKQMTGLIVSSKKNVKLNIDILCRDLFNWDRQSRHENKNWVIHSWLNDYFGDSDKKEENNDSE